MRFDNICTEDNKNVAVRDFFAEYNPCIGCIHANCKGCELKGGQDFDNDNDNIYNS